MKTPPPQQPRWFTATVGRGDQTGSRYVYPTINLDPALLPAGQARGVYASKVRLAGQTHSGALYFGPRVIKQETHDVLEIYLLDFEGDVYGRQVEFSLAHFIRPVQDFPTLEALREQVTRDIAAVRKALA